MFRYDAQTAQLIRVSIGNLGYNDDGNSTGTGCQLNAPCPADAQIAQAGPVIPAYQTDPTMADDGGRVFFMSPVGLTPHALDQAPIDSSGDLAENVYEWEQAGEGSCPAGRSAGCVYLISDGRDAAAGTSTCSGNDGTASSVCLLRTDATGDNVFFQTQDALVPQDTDGGQLNIFDARVGGGFPYTSPPPGCSEDTCQGSPSAPPPAPVVATVTFSGPGNQTADGATAKVRVIHKIVRDGRSR